MCKKIKLTAYALRKFLHFPSGFAAIFLLLFILENQRIIYSFFYQRSSSHASLAPKWKLYDDLRRAYEKETYNGKLCQAMSMMLREDANVKVWRTAVCIEIVYGHLGVMNAHASGLTKHACSFAFKHTRRVNC